MIEPHNVFDWVIVTVTVVLLMPGVVDGVRRVPRWPTPTAPAASICCPLFGAVKAPLAQQIKAVDVAVIAKLVSVPKRPESKEGELNIDPPVAKLEIVDVLKGADLVAGEE
jgi:hypothetical protein